MAIKVLACSIPFQLVSIQFIAYLSAFDAFRALNLVKIPSGCALVLAPLTVVGAGQPLVSACGLFFAIRLATMFGYACLIWKANPETFHPIRPNQATLLGLLKFGSWLSVSSIVGPMLLHSDRLVIGTAISAAATAAYVACIDTVSKIHVIPTSISTTIFPRLASLESAAGVAWSTMYTKALQWTEGLCFPLIAMAVIFGKEILQLWISREFASENHLIFRITAAGMYLNCIAQVPAQGLHALGRPDLTAKSHLIQAILYVPAVMAAASSYGLVGVAAVWAIRVGVDAFIVIVLCARETLIAGSILRNMILRHTSLVASLSLIIVWADEAFVPAAGALMLAIYVICFLPSAIRFRWKIDRN